MLNKIYIAVGIAVVFIAMLWLAMSVGGKVESLKRDKDNLQFQLKYAQKQIDTYKKELELNEATLEKLRKELDDVKDKLYKAKSGTSLDGISF